MQMQLLLTKLLLLDASLDVILNIWLRIFSVLFLCHRCLYFSCLDRLSCRVMEVNQVKKVKTRCSIGFTFQIELRVTCLGKVLNKLWFTSVERHIHLRAICVLCAGKWFISLYERPKSFDGNVCKWLILSILIRNQIYLW